MSQKSLIWIGLTIGSTVGSYLPSLFGQDIFSGWSLFWGTVGSFLGVWAGYKIGKEYF